MTDDATSPVPSIAAPAAIAAGPPRTAAEWIAPEPWPAALRRIVTNTASTGVAYYGLQALFGMPVSPLRAGLFGLLMTGVTSVGFRRGRLLPAAPMLIYGTLLLVAGGFMAVTGTLKGDPAPPAVLAIFGLFGTALLGWGLHLRRGERAFDRTVAAERVAPVLLERAELARRVEAMQVDGAPAARRVLRWMVGAAVAVAGGIAAIEWSGFGDRIPDAVWGGALVAGWGAVAVAVARAGKAQRVRAGRFGLICPACDQPFHAAAGNRALMYNLVDAGHCPQCGARIVTEDGA